MTEVMFHFNVPDKLGYACRLLRKASASGRPVGVLAPEPLLTELDRALWSFAPLEFLPHCLSSASPDVLAQTPLVLATDSAQLPHTDVLLHLGDAVPAGFERFERLIELVGTNENDRLQARQRWRHYADRGYAIQRHDVKASH
ncbi:DNA polymerase III subunit chi [Ottowia sp.]|uniref:DNA polymerase III subunit chi n=1 Tax=Ottowia sp. TaxID=1898956 RepID=UPI003A8C7E56